MRGDIEAGGKGQAGTARRRRRSLPARALPALLLALLVSLAGTGRNAAQPAGPVAAPETSGQPSEPGASPTSIQSSLGAYGDPAGVRELLSSRGVEYNLTYIGEVLGNPSGGIRRGSIYNGRLDVHVDADLEKLLGWGAATFHANLYQIHGHGLSRYYLENLHVVSNIEGLSSTRLYELWLEQKLFGGRLSVRAGQLAADAEFFNSTTAALFVSSAFGWPTVTAANLPSGGPAYPLATPGVRVKLAPSESASLLVGVFNGDPAGPDRTGLMPDPQRRDRSGTEFRLRDPALIIAEGAYSVGAENGVLPATIKLGYWHHLGRFNDQRFDALGLSLADPLSSGTPRRFRGNNGVYGVIDQTLYRVPGTTDQGISAFLRVLASPDDRNLVAFDIDGGLAAKGLIPGREDDTFGIGAAYARISRSVRGLDRDAALFAGAPAVLRSSEALIEVTYQAQIVPAWTLQPDFQYVFRPAGKVPNPRDPTGAAVKDAAIFGLRTTIRY